MFDMFPLHLRGGRGERSLSHRLGLARPQGLARLSHLTCITCNTATDINLENSKNALFIQVSIRLQKNLQMTVPTPRSSARAADNIFRPKRDPCFGPKHEPRFFPKSDSCFWPNRDSFPRQNVVKKNVNFSATKKSARKHLRRPVLFLKMANFFRPRSRDSYVKSIENRKPKPPKPRQKWNQNSSA